MVNIRNMKNLRGRYRTAGSRWRELREFQQKSTFQQTNQDIEKGGEASTLFVPNLTINLTYLCYGVTKLLGLWEITKKF